MIFKFNKIRHIMFIFISFWIMKKQCAIIRADYQEFYYYLTYILFLKAMYIFASDYYLLVNITRIYGRSKNLLQA